ncbi:unnamed protein product [Spirodela intermedia]|uniref:RING-type E3 ubiquitin transferase n=1 Tax=Spirodela intermedia TaxID=51605 RepID=A0A7I8J235_SPIIN|nr:unnamed protein product [Spirodela intermedia]CAA6664284.1 unnamed protein product [Spirodela intermedia]
MGDSSSSRDSVEPLLRSSSEAAAIPSRLSVLLGQATGQRGPSLLERRADWGFSRPVVALDISWNVAFVVASLGVLSSTVRERPNVPIRLWIAGYALQCVVHVVLVWVEYRRRSRRQTGGVEEGRPEASEPEANHNEGEAQGSDEEAGGRTPEFRMAKSCESLNTVTSFIWWIVGFYWVVSGGDAFLQDALHYIVGCLKPILRRLAVTLLAFDVLFATFCVALACVIGIALCCCLPCIIAILYTVAGQDGASEADISILPLYKFVQGATEGEKGSDVGGLMVPMESDDGGDGCGRSLLPEDAVCCICLTAYEDATELRSLPCDHHFHSACITKWLSINATCPLCKYNILKGPE